MVKSTEIENLKWDTFLNDKPKENIIFSPHHILTFEVGEGRIPHDVPSAALFTQAAKASIRSLQPSMPFSATLRETKEKRNHESADMLFVYLFTDTANALRDFTRFNVLFIFSSTPTVAEIVSGGGLGLVPCFSNSVAKTDACFTFRQMFAAETAQRPKLRDGISFR